MEGVGCSIVYKSRGLGSFLGLENLWIAFSGYWPERGASLQTGTFKELEVWGVLSRIRDDDTRVLVVASAGNTASAYARICSESGMRCLIIVPAQGLTRMHLDCAIGGPVKIVSLTQGADYTDAIHFAQAVSRHHAFLPEGGVRNVGRRDGMATAILSAVEAMSTLPDYYFQAIGSGTGAIAAHQAFKRLLCDSRFGHNVPRLMLGQNSPFAPVFHSWRRQSSQLVECNRTEARRLSRRILASVLSNQAPAYSIKGGIFEALTESRGDVFAVTNRKLRRAMRLFERREGIDIDPAAGVAVASLLQAIASQRIATNAAVLLHITGGGYSKMPVSAERTHPVPDIEIPLSAVNQKASLLRVWNSFEETGPFPPRTAG